MKDFDEVMTRELRRAASGFEADVVSARNTFVRRRTSRRIGRALAAGAVAVAAVVTFAWIGERVTRKPLPFEGPAPAPAGETVVTETYELGGPLSDIEVTEDAIYFTLGGRASTFVFDPERETETELPGRFRHNLIDVADGIVFADGLGADGSALLVRLDPRTGAETVTRPGVVGEMPADVIYAEGFVWVSASKPGGPVDEYAVAKYDAQTLQRLGTIPVPSFAHLDFGHGRLWVASEGGLLSVDPRTDERTRIAGAGALTDVSVGPGGVWAFERPEGRTLVGRLLRVNPESGEVVESAEVRGYFARVEADQRNGIWVLASETEELKYLFRFDPVSGDRMGEPLELGGGVMQMDSGRGSLWIVDDARGTLARIDVASG